MILKKLFASLTLIGSIATYSQQIGDGFAPVITDFNKELLSGFYTGLNAVGKTPDPENGWWNHLLNLRHPNPLNNHQLQIGSAYTENDRLFFRKFARGLGAAAPTWHEIATRGNNNFNGQQNINGSISIAGTNSLNFSNYGGGFFMMDSEWIRTFGDKNFYHNTGVFRTDGRLEVGPNGDRFNVGTNGKVGIGTTDPSEKLEVGGNVLLKGNLFLQNKNHGILYGSSDFYGNDMTFYTGDGGLNFATTGNPYGIATKSNVKMRILNNGNVGIGTDDPKAKLHVEGAIMGGDFISGGTNSFIDLSF